MAMDPVSAPFLPLFSSYSLSCAPCLLLDARFAGSATDFGPKRRFSARPLFASCRSFPHRFQISSVCRVSPAACCSIVGDRFRM